MTDIRTLFLTVVTALLFILLPVSAVAGGPGNEHKELSAKLHDIDALLNRGENQQTLRLLDELAIDGPGSAERSWRMARVHYEIGRQDETNAPEFFRKSEEYARTAIAQDPDSSDGYKWLAIALGAQMKYLDTQTRVRQSREIKGNIEKAIELNPDDDISYLVLSRWHYKVSDLGVVARTFAKIIYGGIPEASLVEAEKLLLHAIALRDRIAHRYNLAKVYDRMERYEDKKIQLQKALLLPVTFPEEHGEQEKARKKLHG